MFFVLNAENSLFLAIWLPRFWRTATYIPNASIARHSHSRTEFSVEDMDVNFDLKWKNLTIRSNKTRLFAC